MKFICWPQIPTKKPRAIRWHVIHGVELIAQECWAHQRDAFLRQLSAGRMYAFKSRRQPAQDREISRRLTNSFLSIFRGWRRRRHYFPRERRAMRRISREKNMQQCRPAPWQADDEQRFADVFL